MSVEKFSDICRQDGLEKLDTRYASSVCYDACVTPCSLIVALLYLDRLRTQNPEYLANTSPSQVFLVATVSIPPKRVREREREGKLYHIVQLYLIWFVVL